ncbi:hypothetical protein BaRGS_00012123, partial [Batillaria attramentaria]
TSNMATVITISVLILAILGHVTSIPDLVRGPRSDDREPLEAAVSGLTQKVDELTAQLQAQGTQMNVMSTQIAALQQPVAFSATFSANDIEGLGTGQTLKFDKVLFNAGSGYDHTTGYFTAPVMLNIQHPEKVEVDLYKGSTRLVRSAGCCTGYDSGSNMAAVHLEKGETTHVQVSQGSIMWGYLHTTFTGYKLTAQ